MEIIPESARIRTVIVEDEPKSLLALKTLLERYCPDIELVGTASSVSEGIRVIPSIKPELVFMDIAMPDGNAFDLLNRLDKKEFEIIFITAYNDYALKAFEFSALHYLLKPINYLDLQQAVQRYQKLKPSLNLDSRLEILNENLERKYTRISLPTQEGLTVVELASIMHIESSSNYSLLHFAQGDSLLVSKSLNQFEEMLAGLGFVRIHNTHIINGKQVRKYHRGRGGRVTLTNGTNLAVSASRKKTFLDYLHRMSINIGE